MYKTAIVIEYTNQFKRDLKLAKRRNLDLNQLNKLMQKIASQLPLDIKRSHADLFQ
jgi:mRNA-degrading endonuclease YafQ of YafQ-DinJ toxin-antitoxin module